MLDIFVCKTLAAWALCQSHAFTERSIIRFAVGRVERVHREATFDTDHEVVLLRIILWESGVKMDVSARCAGFTRLVNLADGSSIRVRELLYSTPVSFLGQ